jgi:hypothetical protein
MTLGLKALFSIAPLLFVVTPSIAADVTYKDYTNASSEIWKGGFVLGISQYMAAVAQPDEEAPYPVRNAYQRCLAGSKDVLLVRQVDAYVAKNSVSANEPMVRVVIRALFNLCRSEIEKVKPSKAAGLSARLRQHQRGPRLDRPASLDGSTPDQAYFTPLPLRMAA